MKFSDHIPDDLNDNPYWGKLVKVFEELQAYKEATYNNAVRFYKPVIYTEKMSFLRQRVVDLGYPPVPEDFPKEILDAMILNAKNVMALKATNEGLPYWLWVLTFGRITVDSSAFFPIPDFIIPSDLSYGYVSHHPFNDAGFVMPLYLFSDISDFGTQTLIIDISTKYYYLVSLQDYIRAHIAEYISFSDGNTNLVINFTDGVYHPYDKPYQYFVKQ